MSIARRHLGLIGLFAALTLLLTWPLARTFGSAIPGDSFDGWQNYWNLWWVRTALIEQHTHPYFTSALYHPGGVALWFQTLNLFNGLTSLPLQLAFNLFTAYNAVVVFSFTVAGYGATLMAVEALLRAGARPGRALWLGGITAGVVFTFSPFHFAHLLGHMQVFSLQFVPFYVLYLLRLTRPTPARPRYRDAALAGFFLVLAGYCDWYAALYLALFTALMLLWLLLRRQLRTAHIAGLALTAGVFLLFTLPALTPMVRESIRYDFMRPPPGQIAELSADALSFVLPSPQHALWGAWVANIRANWPNSPSETTLYAGLIPVLLAGFALWKRRLRLGFWALAVVVFIVFALGPVLHFDGRVVTLPGGRALPLPYDLLLRLPFLDIARTVARYDLLVMLSLGVLAGAGMYLLFERSRRLWLSIPLLALILFEFAPTPYPISPPDTPAWYATLAVDARDGAVLNLPANWDRPGYLLYQTVHGKPLTAGYISRDDPRTLPTRVPVLSDFRSLRPDINAVDPATYAPTLFDFLDIRWVVIDRYKMPGGEERAITDALVAQIFGGRAPVFEDERLTVYETWPPDQALPFIELGFDWGPLQADGTRRVNEAATLIIHAPSAMTGVLQLDPATALTGPVQLEDTNGIIQPPRAGETTRWELALQPGPNRFLLRSPDSELTIQHQQFQPSSPPGSADAAQPVARQGGRP